MLRWVVIAVVLMPMLVFLSSPVQAHENHELGLSDDIQTDTISKNSESHKRLWEAGVFATGISQPAYPGADDRARLLLALPYMIYRGKYLRIDSETVGVRAIKTQRTELDVGIAGSLGSRAFDIEARQGMDDLGLLVEFGPRLKINLGEVSKGRRSSRIQLAARGVFDVNDHLQYHGISIEPQWLNEFNLADSWHTSASLAAIFGNQQLVDTFYRATAAEATSVRPAYQAKSGLIALRASLFASRMIVKAVWFFSYLKFDSVAGAANYSSPLIRRDSGWSAGIGMAWTLARSELSARE